jgi:ribulose-phosphate 3-epimerase
LNLHRTVHSIKALGKRAGVAINPATPAAVLEEILPEIDQVLVMTVDPGFGHQQFLHTTLSKITRVRQMIDRLIPGCDLEVDGGIDPYTARLAVDAGANVGRRIVRFWRSRRSDRGNEESESKPRPRESVTFN